MPDLGRLELVPGRYPGLLIFAMVAGVMPGAAGAAAAQRAGNRVELVMQFR